MIDKSKFLCMVFSNVIKVSGSYTINLAADGDYAAGGDDGYYAADGDNGDYAAESVMVTMLLIATITILLLMATMLETFDHELCSLIGFSKMNHYTLTHCHVVNHTQT